MPDRRARLRAGVTEVVLIVASILLAFAIDAAWERRGEAIESRELLTGLRSEFEFQRSELIRFRDRWLGVREATGRLLAATRAEGMPDPVAMDSLFLELTDPATFDARTGTLQAATGSGQLGLIGSRELRDKLAAWAGVVAEVQDNEIAMRGFILSELIPYLAQQGVPLSRSWALMSNVGLQGEGPARQHWPGRTLADDQAADVYRRILQDQTFETLVATRYSWINVEEYEDAIDFVEELLGLIDQDLPS